MFEKYGYRLNNLGFLPVERVGGGESHYWNLF
jgi:hypothetical protein